MMRASQDMKEVGTGMVKIDVGYGNIEVVSMRVADYIYRLRESLRNAGLSENPRKNIAITNDSK